MLESLSLMRSRSLFGALEQTKQHSLCALAISIAGEIVDFACIFKLDKVFP